MRGREYARVSPRRQVRTCREETRRTWRQHRCTSSDRTRGHAGGDITRAIELHGTSLLFTDFPEGSPRAEMWPHFQKFGHVGDVFIPNKKSREGKEFGFIRYRGVNNPVNLVMNIRSVNVGMKALTVNVSRFRRNGFTVQDQAPVTHQIKDYRVAPDWKNVDSPAKLRNHNTYSEAVKNDVHKNTSIPAYESIKTVALDHQKEEEICWLRQCAVGEVKNSRILNDIFHLLRDEGFQCETKYVGGFRVLLQCESREIMLKMLTDEKDMLENWFQRICPWEKEIDLSNLGRLIWGTLEGIPLFAWAESINHRKTVRSSS